MQEFFKINLSQFFLKRSFRYCIIFLFFAATASAQKYSQKADSLRTLIAAAKSDTQLVRLLNVLGDLLAGVKDKDAVAVTDRALALSKKTGNSKGELDARIAKAVYEYFIRDSAAEKRFAELSAQLETIEPELTFEKGRVLFFLGRIHYDRGEPTKALGFLDKATPLFEKIKHQRMIASVYNMTGLAYWNLDKPEKALELFIKSADIKRKIKDVSGLAASLGNMALIYSDLKLYDKSVQYHLQSVRLNEQIGFVEGVTNEYINLGITYYQVRQLDSAEFYVRKALELALNGGDKNVIARCYNNLGLVYDQRENAGAGFLFFLKKHNK
jgi:tetratricopeptide (TPR) repeat protein